MENNRAAIIKELVAIGVVVVLLLSTGGFLVRNVIVGLRSLDEARTADDLSFGEFAKAFRDLAGKILPADGKTAPPGSPTAPPTAPPAAPASGPKPPATAQKGEVTNIRFFEGGREMPALKQRTYTSRFSPQVKYIYTEVAYKNNNYKVADAAIPLVIQYLDPTGRKVAELQKNAQPKKEWASAVFAAGVGAAEVGSWRTGQYTVKVFFDGDFIGDYKFAIE